MSDLELPAPPMRTWPDYRAVWRWHFYAGMICIPFVIILSLSGAIYLFKPQIEAWNDRPYDHLQIQGQPASAAAQIHAALDEIPGSTLNAYELPQAPDAAARVIVNDQGRAMRVYVHPESLKVLHSFPESDRFMRWLFRLHGELLMGNRGSMIVELAASWTIIMILTGLYLWWPRQSKGWGGIVYPRLRGGSRMFWRDIHSVTGFWISGLALGLLLSGLPWAKFWGDYFKAARRLTGTAVARQDWTNSSESGGPRRNNQNRNQSNNQSRGGEHSGHDMGQGRNKGTAPPIKDYSAVDRIVDSVAPLNLAPPVLIAPPAREGADWTAKSNTANRPWRENLVVNGTTGEIVSRDGFAERHWIDKLVAIGIAAHEGQLFGWPNQLLGLITAAGLVLLSVSGIVMWWRRRDAGVLGAPRPALSPRISIGLCLLVILLGIYLPLFGASLIIVLLLEKLVLSRVKGISTWLGLRATTQGLTVLLCVVASTLQLGCSGPSPVVGGTEGTLKVAGTLLSETQLTLYRVEGTNYEPVGFAVTDSDGAFQLVTNGAKGPLKLEPGNYHCTLQSAGAPVEFPAAYLKPETTPVKVDWTESESELDLVVPGW